MNDMMMARQAYGEAAHPVRSPRDTEYLLLARLSHALKDAAATKSADFPSLARAISKNLSFWSTLSGDVTHPDNALPKETRAGIFWLAQFVQVESSRILRGEGDIDALIEVNVRMMQGLRPQAVPE